MLKPTFCGYLDFVPIGFSLCFLFHPCDGAQLSDMPQEIEVFCHQMTALLPSSLHHVTESAPYQELVQYKADQKLKIGVEAFERVEELIAYNPYFIYAIEPHQVSHFLDQLSQKYLHASCIPEFHSFQLLKQDIYKLNESEYRLILFKLIELGRLEKAILLCKDKVLSQQVEMGDLGLHFLNKLSLLIEESKKLDLTRYFYDLTEQTKEEELAQTIDALYMAHLNQFWTELSLKMEKEKRGHLPLPLSLKNKKIVVFTCSYGTGHRMTAAALQQIVGGEGAKVSIHDLSTGIFLRKDHWRTVFKLLGVNYDNHPLNGVDLFNLILKHQYYFLVNTQNQIDLFVRKMLALSGQIGVASPAGILKNSWEKKQIREILLFERPDHLVTTYHMDLNPMLEVAEELRIPVLHIPTDYDMKCWAVFDKTPPAYPHFKSLVPNYQIAKTLETRAPLRLAQLVQEVGIPLRQPFYETLSEAQVDNYRHSLRIGKREKVLILSAGGSGQNLPHPELLANSSTWDLPLRLEVIAGKNVEFATHLQKQLTVISESPLLLQGNNPFVTIEIVRNPNPSKKGTAEEFFVPAEELSRILDIADVSIAKAGGISVAELLFKGVPIVFDQRKTPFSWEQFNVETVLEQNRGISNSNLGTLEQDIKYALELGKKKSSCFTFEHAAERLNHTILRQIEEARSSEIADLALRDLQQMGEEEMDRNWNLSHYFGHIKLITSNPASERFKRCRQELQQIGLEEADYRVVPGVNGAQLDPAIWQRADNWDAEDSEQDKKGRMGCFMAHYQAIKESAESLKEAQEHLELLLQQEYADPDALKEAERQINKYSSVLIIEDNTGFGLVTNDREATLKGSGKRLRETLRGLPPDWDMFYFMTMADNWGPSVEVSPELVRLRYGVLTKCYAVHAKMYPAILDLFESLIFSDQKIYPVDHVLAVLQKNYKCYAPSQEALTYRFGSLSEVQNMRGPMKNWQPAIRKLENPI